MRRRLPPALQQRDFSLFWMAILATSFAGQMVAVAVGWQVYSIHENPLDLGLIGLAQFLPLPLLALPAGHIADRLSRRRVFAAAIVLDGVIAVLLLVVTIAGARSLWPFLALALASGAAAALGWPASRSLPPTLVYGGSPRERDGVALDRLSDGDDRGARGRWDSLRHPARARLHRRGGPVCDLTRLRPPGERAHGGPPHGDGRHES